MIYGSLSTEYYDLVKPKAFPEELAFYKERLDGAQGPILEGMCGSGRLLLPLLQGGLKIEGLDYSQPMLERCRVQGNELGLAPVLYQQSIETVSLPKKYEVIMIVGGSFQLIFPREKAIEAIRVAKAHLVKGGRLFLDTFIPWEFLYENAEQENFVNTVKTPSGSSITLTSHTVANKYEQCFTSKNTYQETMAKTVLRTEKEEMPVLWYYHHETVLLLESLGFNKVIVHPKKLGKHPELTVYEAIN